MMNVPEYVSKDEVKRVCTELGLRDWSEISGPVVTTEEASTILQAINAVHIEISIDAFLQGLQVELEHGVRYKDANVTNNHPLLTGKIALAHLKEKGDYYKRLLVAETEGDLMKAIISRNIESVASKYQKLIGAQQTLAAEVEKQLKSNE